VKFDMLSSSGGKMGIYLLIWVDHRLILFVIGSIYNAIRGQQFGSNIRYIS